MHWIWNAMIALSTRAKFFARVPGEYCYHKSRVMSPFWAGRVWLVFHWTILLSTSLFLLLFTTFATLGILITHGSSTPIDFYSTMFTWVIKAFFLVLKRRVQYIMLKLFFLTLILQPDALITHPATMSMLASGFSLWSAKGWRY